MYPQSWHSLYGDKTRESAQAILPPLLNAFAVQSFVEVGCGNAHWSQVALEAGIRDYLAIDGAWNNREKLLVNSDHFLEHNLAGQLRYPRRFDLAICLEVAEHVEERGAKDIVRTLVTLSDVVLFGAAIPYQGGHGHVNEQWPSWWRALFKRESFELFDLVRPRHWNDTAVHYWYRQNCFVYVNTSNAGAIDTASKLQRIAYEQPVLTDAVHPEKFCDTASYESISGIRLLTRTPKWLFRRIVSRLAGTG